MLKYKVTIENRDGIPGNTAVFYAESLKKAKTIQFKEGIPHDHMETAPVITIEENTDG